MKSIVENIKKYQTAWVYGFVGLVAFLFYKDIFLARGAWLVADHAEQHFPWASHLAQSIKQGILPFWTNQIHAGYPIAAEGQIGTFYLPNLIFYYLFPIRQGYAWNIVFHVLLSAVFMIRFLRSLKITQAGIVFGTLVYLFGATLGGAYYNITSLKTLAWFPLALILVDSIIAGNDKYWRKVFGLAVIFTLQLLAGYLQFAAYAMLFTGLYGMFRLFEDFSREPEDFFRIFFALLIAAIIAAVITFPQLFMTFTLAKASNRSDPQEAFAYIGSYSPLALSCFLFPSFEGMFVSKMYLGIFPIFFMFVAFFAFKENKMKALYWLVILSFLLAMGRYSPLYILIIKLTKFYSFRTPVKFIYFGGFFLCVLCAWGVSWFLSEENKEKWKKVFTAYRFFLYASCGIVLLAYFMAHYFEQPLRELGEKLVRKMIYGQPGHPSSWEHYQGKLDSYIMSIQNVLYPGGKVFLIPFAKMAACISLLWVYSRQWIKKGLFFVICLGILIVDLNFSYSDIRGDYDSYENFYKKSVVEDFLQQNLGDARYFNYSENPANAPLPASKNMLSGINSANAYSPLVTKAYYDFMHAFGGINDSTGYQLIDDQYLEEQLGILGFLNVKYIVSDRELDFRYLKKVFAEGSWSVYENELLLEPFYQVSAYEVKSYDEIMTAIHETEIRLDRLVFVERDPEKYFGDSGIANSDEVDLIKQTDHEKVLRVQNTTDSWLVFSQSYDVNWKALVDGEEAEIYRANAAFSAIPIAKGRHEIVLKYHPFSHLLDKRRN